ncbi:hypothetical protein [Hydrogenophaga sp. BPS33]|uniref:hypothetical protein n=1 Tax=Hydrogenophaga sp. BPS33 TaxID=2651974 RepID=UPI0019177A9A|nr:hypothetical protein [Hydrogenophaga sp. BPS33]
MTLLEGTVFNFWDKAQHASGFAWLAVLGVLSYPKKPRGVALSLLAYGAAIELAQAATGWRYGEWSDLAADGVGILIGMFIAAWVLRKTPRTAS